MRRKARVDANQAEIVDAMRRIGAVVTHLHQLGVGVPDLLVSYRQCWYLFEVKMVKGKLRPEQQKWFGEQRAPVYVVTSPLQAVGFLQGSRP